MLKHFTKCPDLTLPGYAARLFCWLLVIVALCESAIAHADDETFKNKFIALGTATRGGTAQGVGNALCETINRTRDRIGIRCVPYTTTGFTYNVKAIKYGELTMGLSSASIASEEFKSKQSGEKGKALRLVMALYPMPVAVISRRVAKVRSAEDLRGHSINIGNYGSGIRDISEMLLQNLGLTRADFSQVTEQTSSQMSKSFCDGNVDIVVQDLGHPSPFYHRLIDQCDGVLVSFPPELVEKILRSDPMMTRMVIPGGLYKGYPEPTPSFGYMAVLMTNASVSEQAVMRFVQSIVSQLPEINRDVPVLSQMNVDTMFRPVGMIPFHKGVVEFLNSRERNR